MCDTARKGGFYEIQEETSSGRGVPADGRSRDGPAQVAHPGQNGNAWILSSAYFYLNGELYISKRSDIMTEELI